MTFTRTTLGSIIFSAVLLAAGIPGRAQSQASVEIPAILSSTGPNAVVGAGEAAVMRVAETVVNASGGIKGRPLKFVVLDDQSITQNTVSLFTQALGRKSAAIIGPQSTTTCDATAPLIAKTGPVMYCLSPGLHPEPGSFAFSSSVS